MLDDTFAPLAAVAAALLLALAPRCAAASAATDDQADLAARAAAAYDASRWGDAIGLYRQRVQSEPGSARDWYRLGVALYHDGGLPDALIALARARDLGAPPATVDVDLARAHALAGRPFAALNALRSALASGYANPSALKDSPEFAALRSDSQFESLLEQAQRNRTPCVARPALRQFDFWLGAWDVYDAQGNRQGSNRITPREGGCYLFEQWTGVGGSSGSSINYYDAARGKWVQHWVSQGGTQIQIEGGLDDDGSMLLVGRIYTLTTGQGADFRGRWTPLDDGRVRQFFEQSSDGGRTWTPWFDGYYTRTAPAEPVLSGAGPAAAGE